MPIMSGRGWDDARATTRLLVGTAVECLQNPKKAPERVTALDNIYRLLESFRTNPIFGFTAIERRGHAKAVDAFTISPPREKHLTDVRDVISDAIAVAFRGKSTDQAVVEVEEVLRLLAYPNKGKPTKPAVQRATRFFTEVSKRLAAA
jgi:hypothetical protein